jgi:SsrA-binding protein
MKIVAQNKKAYHEYHILDTYEAGIELHGDEVKSMRAGHCSLVDSFARVDEGEAVLYKMNIPIYKQSSYFQSEPVRARKLLLHKREISKLADLTATKGVTLIPLKIYFTDKGLIKVEIGVAKGKKLFDKREDKKKADVKREIAREMKKYS